MEDKEIKNIEMDRLMINIQTIKVIIKEAMDSYLRDKIITLKEIMIKRSFCLILIIELEVEVELV